MKKVLLTLLLGATPLLAAPFEQAEVTRVVNQVSLLQPEKAAAPAEVGDVVKGRTLVRTGNESRAELRFPDQTIARLGANAIFQFENGGRGMLLERGTMLFSSPRGAGGGEVQAGAVTAAVTGTDFLVLYVPGGAFKLVVLEGKVQVYFTASPRVRRTLRAGQLLTIPDGATELPSPVTVDLKQLVGTSRLLESGGFSPLASNILILRAANRQQGRILRMPDSVGRDVQSAQITRRDEPPAPPKAVPQVTPRPAPPAPPVAKPPKKPPTPPPTGTPTH